MMRIDPWALTRMTCFSALLGVALSILLELLRFIWSLAGADGKPCNRGGAIAQYISLFFRDIVFFVVSGCMFSVLVYSTNNGQIRFAAVLGVVAGVLIGYYTVGRLARCVCSAISRVLREVAVMVMRTLVATLHICTDRVGEIGSKRMRIKRRKGSDSNGRTKDA